MDDCKYAYTATDALNLLDDELLKIKLQTPEAKRLIAVLTLASLHLKTQILLTKEMTEKLGWDGSVQQVYSLSMDL